MTTEIELIAEMADALYTMVPTCFCHAKHCSKCENWERAKKFIDLAGVFADLKAYRKSKPSGGSVNTPRPPQETPAALPWQPGPACGGGLPPESAQEVLVDTGGLYCHVRYRHSEVMSIPWERYYPWDMVRKWLIIK